MLFACDVMLGKLTRWLRCLGVKTIYSNARVEDDDLIKECLEQKAVLLTRDEALYNKARGYVPSLLIKSNDCIEQLREVKKAFKIRVSKTSIPQTLCPLCGSELKRVSKKSVRERVWPRVFKRNKLFWECQNKECKQIYWRGTHVKEIKKVLGTL
jgi:uncharacterized protein with PIN domain